MRESNRFPAQLADVRAALEARSAHHRRDLEALVRIPSVSAPGFDHAELRRCADAVRALLADRGLERARLLDADGGPPAVYAEHLGAGPEAPTVLLYAHYDVQPPGPPAEWATPAFEPTERYGRLYGRGAADDKAGILVHVAAVDAWLRARGALPVNVKVIIEGEEEIGSEHLDEFLAAHADLLACDALVITDSVNWKVGTPAVTATLRGLIDAQIEVRALDHPLHSGMYGGPVPDALSGLLKILAALTDEHGAVAIPAFDDDAAEPTPAQRAAIAALDFDADDFRAEAGMLDGVQFAGEQDRDLLERLWLRPAVTVIGIDAPSVAASSNTLPAAARARVSIRLGPGQDPQRARARLCEWLESAVPWGLSAVATPGAAAAAYAADVTAPAFQAASAALKAAYGRPPAWIGAGGTIPMVAPLTGRLGGVPALLTGVEDPDTRAHSPNESLHLEDWRRACLAEAYLLELLGTGLR